MMRSEASNQASADLARPVWIHLAEFILQTRGPAYLGIGADGRIEARGGELGSYGLAKAKRGDFASDRLFFLEGLLPAGETPLYLPHVEVEAKKMEIHLFHAEGLDWVLLMETRDAGPSL